VSTQVPTAQVWFDQGLAQLFGFAHEDAIRSFQIALQADPGLAIANWGISYAYGPNINLGMDAWRATRANEALARALAQGGGVSPLERALIDSLTVRFSTVLLSRLPVAARLSAWGSRVMALVLKASGTTRSRAAAWWPS